MVWVAVAAVLLATIVSLVAYLRPARARLTAVISEIPPPPNARFDFRGETGGPPAMAPDGRALAFSAVDASGKKSLWLRSLDSGETRPLVGTEGAAWPFWSKDNRALGFFADGKLKTIEASGGSVSVLADVPSAGGGSWNQDGTILFVSVKQRTLYRVAVSGGSPGWPCQVVPLPVIKLDESKYWACGWPVFLPDGNHFLYSAYSDDDALSGICFASLDGKENRLLTTKGSDALYAQGFLLFNGDGLMAQAFDPERGQLHGDPHHLIADEILSTYRGIFDVSKNGLFIYQRMGKARLGLFDRSGKELDFNKEVEAYGVSLSPDGRKVAFAAGDVHVYELERGIEMTLTANEPYKYIAGFPVWSPDGDRIIFPELFGQGRSGIYQKPSDGAGARELLMASETPGTTLQPTSWSTDGRFILYSSNQGGGGATHLNSEIWVLPLEGDRKPRLFVQTPLAAYDGQFSPDVRWVAYTSRESGREQVYVVPFDADAFLSTSSKSTNAKAVARLQISVNGGRCPRWRRDGKEIFYLSSGNQIMAFPVKERGNSLEVQTAQPLFGAMVVQDGSYDVTPDGKKFVIATSTQPITPLTLVVNWTALLASK